MPAKGATLKYRPDIDGLRAIAVLAIVFYHAHLGCPGGYVGVDIFFVISGYLITGVILRQVEQGTFRSRDFWLRRVRRLLPALAVLTLSTALLFPYFLLPVDCLDLAKVLIAQPLLLVNLYFWRTLNAGYFNPAAETRPLLHTWSLGVEEQFYLLFPLAILLLGNCPKRRRLGILVATVLSAGLCILLTPSKPVVSFFTLPTRAWEMLAGTLAFLAPPLASKRRAEALSWAGLLACTAPILLYGNWTLFPGSAALLPVGGTAVFIWCNGLAPSRPARWISLGPLLFIGRISYSLYLWHWPLLAVCRYYGLLSAATAWCCVGLSLLAAFLSYRYVEQPARLGAVLPTNKHLVAAYLAYTGACFACGGLLLALAGFPKNWSAQALGFQQPRLADPNQYDQNLDRPYQPVYLGDPVNTPCRFLLWGDSHAKVFHPVLDALARKHHCHGLQLTKPGYAPLLSQHAVLKRIYSPRDSDKWTEMGLSLIQEKDFDFVILAARWGAYRRIDLSETFARTRSTLADLGPRVVVLADVPTYQVSVPRMLALSERFSGCLQGVTRTRSDYQRELAHFAQVFRGAMVLEPRFFLEGPGPNCPLEIGGQSLYRDGDHLTPFGAMRLQPELEAAFTARH